MDCNCVVVLFWGLPALPHAYVECQRAHLPAYLCTYMESLRQGAEARPPQNIDTRQMFLAYLELTLECQWRELAVQLSTKAN